MITLIDADLHYNKRIIMDVRFRQTLIRTRNATTCLDVIPRARRRWCIWPRSAFDIGFP